eukprot:1160394-Pelagomonas_calceolata.AAC.6
MTNVKAASALKTPDRFTAHPFKLFSSPVTSLCNAEFVAFEGQQAEGGRPQLPASTCASSELLFKLSSDGAASEAQFLKDMHHFGHPDPEPGKCCLEEPTSTLCSPFKDYNYTSLQRSISYRTASYDLVQWDVDESGGASCRLSSAPTIRSDSHVDAPPDVRKVRWNVAPNKACTFQARQHWQLFVTIRAMHNAGWIEDKFSHSHSLTLSLSHTHTNTFLRTYEYAATPSSLSVLQAEYHDILSIASAFLNEAGTSICVYILAAHLAKSLPTAQVFIYSNSTRSATIHDKQGVWRMEYSCTIEINCKCDEKEASVSPCAIISLMPTVLAPLLAPCAHVRARTRAIAHTHTHTHTHADQTALIVEPRFRSHFELPRASHDYAAFLAAQPDLVIAEADMMNILVGPVAKRMADEFKSM